NARIVSPYELELNATSTSQKSEIFINIPPNTPIVLTGQISTGSRIDYYWIFNDGTSSGVQTRLQTTTPSNVKQIQLRVVNTPNPGKFTFTNVMLTLGSTEKPFIPHSKSYLFADVKLGAIGDKRDILYSDNGHWILSKVIEKD